MNRLDSGMQRKLRHRKVKFFYVMQQLKGKAMNRIKVSRFVISVQLAKWDSLSQNYTFYICCSGWQQYVEVACLGQRSSAGACKTQAVFQSTLLIIKHGLHGQCWWSDAGTVIRVWFGYCELLLEAASFICASASRRKCTTWTVVNTGLGLFSLQICPIKGSVLHAF